MSEPGQEIDSNTQAALREALRRPGEVITFHNNKGQRAALKVISPESNTDFETRAGKRG